MSKWYARAVAVLFVAFVFGLALAQAVLPDRAFSDEENRVLQQVPAVSAGAVLSGRLQQESEDYIADQFAGRDGWIALKSALERLSGKKENNGVYLGREETLLRRYDEADAARLEQNAAAVERFAAQCPAETYAAFVPSSTEIWADRLPRWADSADEAAGIRRALGQMPSVRALDVYAALEERAGEEIYYRTDHHWTTRGAYYAYAAMARGMGLTPRAEEDFTPEIVSDTFTGTLYSRSAVRGITPDRIERWVPAAGLTLTVTEGGDSAPAPVYDGQALEGKDQYTYFLGGNHALAVLENPAADSGRRLLLVRDSFADCQAPFWAQHFAQVHLVDLRYYKQPLSEYVAEHGIDTVVFLYGYESFASDASLTFLQ